MKTKATTKKARPGGGERASEPQIVPFSALFVLSASAAAKYLGVSVSAMRAWRANGEGPRFFYAGDRLVKYRRVDLDSWIESRLSQPAGSR